MPALRNLSSIEENWIRSNHPSVTPKAVSEYLGVHIHTAIRILVRLGLMKTKTVKYQPGSGAMKRSIKRRCLACKKAARMDKQQYICNYCRRKQREQGLL